MEYNRMTNMPIQIDDYSKDLEPITDDCGNNVVAILIIGDKCPVLMCDKCIDELYSKLESFKYRRRYT